MPRTRKRYYLSDDPENGITPSQLRRLGKARQVEYLTTWFHSYYEDPAMETPYNGREGGYQYIHGGPYDARDEIESEFGGTVSEEVIEQAIESVEEDGISDWAPSSNHPDREDEGWDEDTDDQTPPADLDEIIRHLRAGLQPQFGDAFETQTRARILSEIEKLEFELPTASPEVGGIGHNQPPIDFRMTAKELTIVHRELVILKVELSKPQPDALAVAESTGSLKAIWEQVKHHTTLAGDAFSTSAGSAAGKIVGGAVGAALVGGGGFIIGTLFPQLVNSVVEWLNQVTSFL